jgi:hypothetical protein
MSCTRVRCQESTTNGKNICNKWTRLASTITKGIILKRRRKLVTWSNASRREEEWACLAHRGCISIICDHSLDNQLTTSFSGGEESRTWRWRRGGERSFPHKRLPWRRPVSPLSISCVLSVEWWRRTRNRSSKSIEKTLEELDFNNS